MRWFEKKKVIKHIKEVECTKNAEKNTMNNTVHNTCCTRYGINLQVCEISSSNQITGYREKF